MKRNPNRGEPCSVDGCVDAVVHFNLCSHHHYSARKGRAVKRLSKHTDTLAERFERYVERDPSSGCGLWSGCSSGSWGTGYGTITFRGRVYKAHRLSLMLAGRDLATDQLACHSCDTPLCVNPSHLWVGTHADNMADMVSKGRHRAGMVPRGSAVKTSKLTEIAVVGIRQQLASGVAKAEIARAYGVSRASVYFIANGQSWTHVPLEGAA